MKIQEQIESRLVEIEEIVNSSLANDGDTCETSQRICVLQALNKLRQAVNGIQEQDLKPMAKAYEQYL